MKPYRVLVTGPRNWADVDAVEGQLRRLMAFRFNSSGQNRGIVFVHGACETGVDKIVADFCAREDIRACGVDDDPHPAEWYRADGSFDKTAGPRRNSVMVALGAEVALSFWQGVRQGGSGTFDCTKKAVLAGIRVIIPGRFG